MKEIRTQIIFIICFLAAWQVVYQMQVFPQMMFPSLKEIGQSFIDGFKDDSLLQYTLYSMSLIIKGLAIGIVLAFIFSSIAVVSKIFHSIYNLVVSVCDLLPGVALLPLAILWIGIGEGTIIFIVVHSILWPMSRSIMDGFKSVSSIYIESGKNMGLKGLGLVIGVYLPAAFTHVLSGMRVGWARAWRGLISVEMIFGTTGSGAGIGWFIFMKRTNVDIAGVFAALIVIIIIGIIVEYGVFHTIEKRTVKKWGMVR
ncbi:MAG: ABC transporter permease subunit [Firmicutes bacterium]|jgi:NitT/TauT family transport system permease protein|nr:ABC transporter permease subunit [Bacillota bacterium]NBI63053.1 ABC transporter permease subunit [Clostridiales bacterium]